LWKPPAAQRGVSRAILLRYFRQARAGDDFAVESPRHSGIIRVGEAYLSKITAKDAKRVRKGRKENPTKVSFALFAVFLGDLCG
jgi:hypothetical protein